MQKYEGEGESCFSCLSESRKSGLKRINIGFQNPTEDWDKRGGGGLIMPVEIGHQELRWPV